MMVRCGVLLDLLLCALCVGGAAVAGDEPNDRPDTGDRVFQEQEENGGFHNAQRVTSNCDVVAHVNNARDADMFAFEIEEATFVQAVVTPVEDIDFTLILFNLSLIHI